MNGGPGIRTSKFTEQRIVAAMVQVEGRLPVVEACRKFGIAELRRWRQVEEEDRCLKQLVADLALDKQMRQETLRNNE